MEYVIFVGLAISFCWWLWSRKLDADIEKDDRIRKARARAVSRASLRKAPVESDFDRCQSSFTGNLQYKDNTRTPTPKQVEVADRILVDFLDNYK